MRVLWLFVRAVASILFDVTRALALLALIMFAIWVTDTYLNAAYVMWTIAGIVGFIVVAALVIARMIAIEEKDELSKDKDWTCHE